MAKVIKIDNTCRLTHCDRELSSKKHRLCKTHLVFYYRKGFVIDKPLREYTTHDHEVVIKK